LGNQHSKDVLIDRQIHMSGSHNWLSYRGDRRPRGESTYYVSVPEPVERASQHIDSLFCNAADRAWEEMSQATRPSKDILTRCCITWVIVRRIEHAIEKTLSLSRRRPAFAPLCLELAQSMCLALIRLPMAELVSTQALLHMVRAAPDLVKRTELAGYDAQTIAEFRIALKSLQERHQRENRS
jgi:hypothetical protein